MSTTRQPYPSDVGEDEWAFVAPYLTLLDERALQRKHDLREVYNGLRWLVRTGTQWRMLPHDFPRWEAVYQQTQRWLRAGRFEAIAHDLRLLLRLAAGRSSQPAAVILDARTAQSTPESGAGAGYDGHKRRKGRMRIGRHGPLYGFDKRPIGHFVADEDKRRDAAATFNRSCDIHHVLSLLRLSATRRIPHSVVLVLRPQVRAAHRFARRCAPMWLMALTRSA